MGLSVGTRLYLVVQFTRFLRLILRCRAEGCTPNRFVDAHLPRAQNNSVMCVYSKHWGSRVDSDLKNKGADPITGKHSGNLLEPSKSGPSGAKSEVLHTDSH